MTHYYIGWTIAVVCLCLAPFALFFDVAWWRVAVVFVLEFGLVVLIARWSAAYQSALSQARKTK